MVLNNKSASATLHYDEARFKAVVGRWQRELEENAKWLTYGWKDGDFVTQEAAVMMQKRNCLIRDMIEELTRDPSDE